MLSTTQPAITIGDASSPMPDNEDSTIEVGTRNYRGSKSMMAIAGTSTSDSQSASNKVTATSSSAFVTVSARSEEGSSSSSSSKEEASPEPEQLELDAMSPPYSPYNSSTSPSLALSELQASPHGDSNEVSRGLAAILDPSIKPPCKLPLNVGNLNLNLVTPHHLEIKKQPPPPPRRDNGFKPVRNGETAPSAKEGFVWNASTLTFGGTDTAGGVPRAASSHISFTASASRPGTSSGTDEVACLGSSNSNYATTLSPITPRGDVALFDHDPEFAHHQHHHHHHHHQSAQQPRSLRSIALALSIVTTPSCPILFLCWIPAVVMAAMKRRSNHLYIFSIALSLLIIISVVALFIFSYFLFLTMISFETSPSDESANRYYVLLNAGTAATAGTEPGAGTGAGTGTADDEVFAVSRNQLAGFHNEDLAAPGVDAAEHHNEQLIAASRHWVRPAPGNIPH